MKRYSLFFIVIIPMLSSFAQTIDSDSLVDTQGNQEKRLALVIGNGQYEHGGTLLNPVNDARAIADALDHLGFDVLTHINLDQRSMRIAIDEFGLKLTQYDVGLFFYAGHGVQVNAGNYLIPIDAEVWTQNDVEYNCVPAGRILAKMEDAGSVVNIVILDACRDNPFERSWTRSTKGRGLAFMNAPSGSLIAYATSPGNIASDGTGEFGLYTSALLEYMVIPNISIIQMFQFVRKRVRELSNGYQIPWESTSLEGDFYLATDGSYKTDSIIKVNEYILLDDSQPQYEQLNGTFTDFRDKQKYQWRKIGSQIWMTENLNYYTDRNSWCFNNLPKNCNDLGRLYSWRIATSVCPEGWHLPSIDEWKELIDTINKGQDLIGSAYLINDKGFHLTATGQKYHSDFIWNEDYTWFWTSKEGSNRKVKFIGFAGLKIIRIKINYQKDMAVKSYYQDGHENDGHYIRCIKDQ